MKQQYHDPFTQHAKSRNTQYQDHLTKQAKSLNTQRPYKRRALPYVWQYYTSNGEVPLLVNGQFESENLIKIFTILCFKCTLDIMELFLFSSKYGLRHCICIGVCR